MKIWIASDWIELTCRGKKMIIDFSIVNFVKKYVKPGSKNLTGEKPKAVCAKFSILS
jgi:hypothetical protein